MKITVDIHLAGCELDRRDSTPPLHLNFESFHIK